MEAKSKEVKTIIIGAGISGLCLSHYLGQEDYLVFEASDQVGGKITSVVTNDSLLEYGPNSLMLRTNEVKDLIVDLDLSEDLLYACKSSSARFLAKGTQLIKITPFNLLTKILSNKTTPIKEIEISFSTSIWGNSGKHINGKS